MRFGLLILAAVSLFGAVAAAQEARSPQSAQHVVLPPPPGSYQQSCVEIAFDGVGLSANCRTPDGSMQRNTGIEIGRCATGADITNIGGAIHCAAVAGTMGWGNVLPWGSYVATCDPMMTYVNTSNGYILNARCLQRSGHYRNNLLDLRRCNLHSDIVNNDGLVVCAPSAIGGINGRLRTRRVYP